MCGIIYHADFEGNSVNSAIAEQYEKQKKRGTEGFGLYDVDNNDIFKTPKERKILKRLKNKNSSNILFHHRYPTSTDNVFNACHPFSTQRHYEGKKYILVHNGHINNSYELKTQHYLDGIKYTSVQHNGKFNDSESLLWDFAQVLQGKQTEFKARGGVAFICLEVSAEGNKLYFGRNHNPLNMVFEKGKTLTLSSEGDGEPIKTDTLYTYDFKTGEMTEKSMLIAKSAYTPVETKYHYNRPGYSGYTGFQPKWDRSAGTDEDREKLIQQTIQNHYQLLSGLSDDDIEEMEDELEMSKGAIRPSKIIGDKLFINDDKSLRIKRIKARLAKYLDYADGIFSLAYYVMEEDYEALSASHDEYVYSWASNDPDMVYELEVHRTAMDLIMMNPNWKNDNSVDPGYAKAKEEEESKKVPITERPTITEAKDGIQMELGESAGDKAVKEFKAREQAKDTGNKIRGAEQLKDLLGRNELGRKFLENIKGNEGAVTA